MFSPAAEVLKVLSSMTKGEPGVERRLPISGRTTTAPLEQWSHGDLQLLRKQEGADQAALAPIEHRAYAREAVQENPWIMAPSLASAIPLYTGAKALGLVQARSPASLNEMVQGYRGIFEGLRALSR